MSTLFTILAVGVVFYLMRKSGGGCCGSHNHQDKNGHDGHGSSGSDMDTGHGHYPEKLEFSKNNTDKDPVCSMDINNHSIMSRHLGQSFYFCSDQCKKIFDLNPGKYV